MSLFDEKLLVVRHGQLDVVHSDTVSVECASTRGTVLYENPIGVLSVVASELCFDIEGQYVRLRVQEYEATRTYRVELEDARQIHFYRRLLAQTALSAYTIEQRCARILDHALRTKKLSRTDLVHALCPNLCANEVPVATQFITSEYFLRMAQQAQLVSLLERKVGDSLCPDIQSACLEDDDLFCTAAFHGEYESFVAGVYTTSGPTAVNVAIVHLLADLRCTEKPAAPAWR